MNAARKLRLSTLDGFASALLLALGVAPQLGCGGGVQVEDGEGGGGGNGNGGAPNGTSTTSFMTSTGDVNPLTSSATGTGGGTSQASTGPGVTVSVGQSVSSGAGGEGGTGGGSGGCINPTPVIIDGVDTGLDSCDGGNYRRREALECPEPSIEPDTCCEPACEEGYFCSGAGEVACGCVPICHTDADCADGNLCMCGPGGGQCVPATCRTGDDCGEGQECTSWDSSQGCLYPAFVCTTPADTCGGDADCSAAGQYCVVQPEGNRQCQDGGCAIGRPFLVDEVARTAGLATRGDWCDRAATPALAIDDALRGRLGDAWEHIALMEHASIAAFARFALQLLAVGAPPELLVRTHQAMADETKHARLAFGLASAYRGAPVGPGRLPIDGALTNAVDVAELIRLTIREGCVGETVAALEAGESEAVAFDPKIREVLGTIAFDERAHAELAWSAVGWALDTFGEEVRGVIVDEIALLQAELAGSDLAPLGADDRLLARHGVTTSVARALLRRETIEKVVLPCLRGLASQAVGAKIEPATAGVIDCHLA